MWQFCDWLELFLNWLNLVILKWKLWPSVKMCRVPCTVSLEQCAKNHVELGHSSKSNITTCDIVGTVIKYVSPTYSCGSSVILIFCIVFCLLGLGEYERCDISVNNTGTLYWVAFHILHSYVLTLWWMWLSRAVTLPLLFLPLSNCMHYYFLTIEMKNEDVIVNISRCYKPHLSILR